MRRSAGPSILRLYLGAAADVAAHDKNVDATPPAEPHEIRGLIERALPGTRHETSQVLVEAAHLRRLRSDEIVFQQGEPIPLTLIIRGYGAFRRTTIDGQQLIVGIAMPAQIYGFSSVAATPSTVDLVALMDCEVAIWRGPEVRRLAAADPGFGLAMIDTMAIHMNMITEKVDGFLHQNARRRVVRVLARHRDLFFSSPALLSRAHLPSLVGTSREMTGRVLRQLEQEGTVARVGRTGLRLLRPERLDADAAHPLRDAS
jgi:CRP-like cAMP-binding protein